MTTTQSAPRSAIGPRPERDGPVAAGGPVLDLVIPVFDEAAGLEASVRAVCAHLATEVPFTARVTIADNASTDGTLAVAERLAAELPQVRVVHLATKGRGHALSTAWSNSDAEVLAYCDVDLSTDLSALLPLVAPLVSGHSHLAIGTRLARSSRVVRGPKRELISRSYNLILRTSLAARFSDAQCGFKAIRADVARELLPLVQDAGWFFDTELLVLAERAGLRIHEVPVDWVDDPDSRVDIVTTAIEDLKGVVRVGRELMRGDLPLHEIGEHLPLVGDSRTRVVCGVVEPADVPARTGLLHQLVRFAVVGLASTLAYAVIFLLLRGPMGAQCGKLQRAAAHRGRQHGGQPAGHLRVPRIAARRSPPGAGPSRLLPRLGAHLRLTRAPRRRRPGGSALRRAHRPRGRQPRRHRPAFRPAAAVGVQAPRRGSDAPPCRDRPGRRARHDRPQPRSTPMTAPARTDVLDDAQPSPPARPVVPPTRSVAERFVPAPRQQWERPALLTLLVVTGALYLWDLSASGWANSFYSAAVQAGSESWKAFLFGASDAAASITVDKPPASLWVMGIVVRIFGLSSWSILVPQALMGVATVGVLYASVRRYFNAQAGLVAGAVLALTPVAALMFRYNNPDALLVLLLTLAVYVTLRAVEDGRTRWMVLAGVLVGLGFLTKQLQAVLVVPGIAAVYLMAAPVSVGRRIRDGLLAVGAMVVSAGWWVAIVELTPAADRPYVGGSATNSFLDLTLGYNGLGRIFGRSEPAAAAGTDTSGAAATTATTGGPPGGAGGGMFSSNVGLGRMFSGDLGGHIAWLIPAALILGLAGLYVVGRAARTDVRRAALLLWGATLVVTGLTFSLMDGTFHQYYTVALAPSIGALVGIGGWLIWTRRTQRWALPVLAGTSLVTTGWAFAVLSRSPDWNPWLRWVVLVVGLLAAAGVLLGRRLGTTATRAAVALALVAALVGPTAWTIQTVLTPHTGGAVTTGPAVVGSNASGPGADGGPGGGPGGTGGPPTGQAANSQNAGGATTTPGRGTTTVSDTVVEILLGDADGYTWVAATTGSEDAASYQLPTGHSVMPIGGFNGGDPSPTLEQFQAYVSEGQIHYFIAGSLSIGGGGGQMGGETSTIASWVAENFTVLTVDGVTMYDLTAPVG